MIRVLVAGLFLVSQNAAAQPLLRHLTFSENFGHFAASDTGMIGGRAVWQTTFKGGIRTLANNHEIEWYEDKAPFHVAGATLEITARPVSGLPEGLSYASGLITTEQSFNQLYGYFEICAQLPRGRGLWPAFWLLPSDGSWPPEIDGMEMLGGDTTSYYVSTHALSGRKRVDEITKISSADLSAGFHVFGVAWQADHIRFYLDHKLVHESATPGDMHKPMYMLLNLAVGGAGSWPGAAGENVSGIYRIAWVRAWQFDAK
jgi:beta-glucanase (GH16 family)